MNPKKSSAKGCITKSDMKKIARLLLLAAVLILGIKYFETVINAVVILIGVLSPFLLGAAIAFVLNVPMRQIEHILFGGKRAEKSKF